MAEGSRVGQRILALANQIQNSLFTIQGLTPSPAFDPDRTKKGNFEIYGLVPFMDLICGNLRIALSLKP